MPHPRTVPVALAAALAVLVAGCSTTTTGTGTPASPVTASSASAPSSSAASSSRPSSSGSTTAPRTGSSSAAPAAGVPTVEQLKAALLSQAQVGSGFTPQSTSDDDSAGPSGCPKLDPLLNENSQATADQRQAEVSYEAQSQTSYAAVLEALLAEPADRMTTDYTQLSAALASCTRLTFDDGSGASLTLTASPINLAPGATALRLDGQVQSVQVNGYLAVDLVRPTTALLFFYLQANSGSSQLADALFQTAVQNAQQKLPG